LIFPLELYDFPGKLAGIITRDTLYLREHVRVVGISGAAMATFLLCWALVSVVGTLIALSMIRSGKRHNRRAEDQRQNLSEEAQPSAVKLF
jgi:hypothetical protein